MSGYVASARIVRAAPRLARPGGQFETFDRAPQPESPELVIVDADRRVDHDPTLAERLNAFRERWSQLTFYLFDANSWRS
jgi:hypothetical protein